MIQHSGDARDEAETETGKGPVRTDGTSRRREISLVRTPRQGAADHHAESGRVSGLQQLTAYAERIRGSLSG